MVLLARPAALTTDPDVLVALHINAKGPIVTHKAIGIGALDQPRSTDELHANYPDLSSHHPWLFYNLCGNPDARDICANIWDHINSIRDIFRNAGAL